MADLSVELTHAGFSSESFSIMGLSDAAEVLKTVQREMTGEDAERLIVLFAAWERAEEEEERAVKVARAHEKAAARAFRASMERADDPPERDLNTSNPDDVHKIISDGQAYFSNRFWEVRELYRAWQRRIDELKEARARGRMNVKQAKAAFRAFVNQDWRQMKLFSY